MRPDLVLSCGHLLLSHDVKHLSHTPIAPALLLLNAKYGPTAMAAEGSAPEHALGLWQAAGAAWI